MSDLDLARSPEQIKIFRSGTSAQVKIVVEEKKLSAIFGSGQLLFCLTFD